MGASGWYYAVPYHDDVAAALEELRASTFAAGDYYRDDEDDLDDGPEATENRRAQPTSPDELLAAQADSGTHSIIDIDAGISDHPRMGTVSPLTAAQLRSLFGTTEPTAEQVRAWAEEGGYAQLRRRWEGVYLVSYDATHTPDLLHFAGFSGD